MRLDLQALGRGSRAFFTRAGLPRFLIGAAVVYEAFLLAVVFAPESTGAWGGFAREFKQWCFRYDARTGGMEWAAVWVMLVEPAFVVLMAAWLWRRALRGRDGCAAVLRPTLAGAAAAALAMAVLYATGRPAPEADTPLPFPGERLRTQLAPPAFRFVDQAGEPQALSDARGRVTLVTGIYARCSTTCPEILVETKTLLATLPPAARAAIDVVAVSLDPEEDTMDLMRAVTSGYGFSHPQFRYLNGPPAGVHAALTQLGFAPVKNPTTRVIEHANLFLLIDAQGRIAYRFTLDASHRAWLREALLALTRETGAS